ncbi:MAG: hypothetical protein ABFS24_06125 [Pseudomonadota bacterium]
MKHKILFTGFGLLICVLPGTGVDTLVAAEATSSGRIQSVEKLVETSSAARKIEASSNSRAIAAREEARGLLSRARQAIASGDQEAADKLLNQATKTMFEAVRELEQDQSLVDKDYQDFDARLESITALCDAYDRIRQEKDLGPAEDSELYSIVQKKRDAAKSLKNEGKVDEGRKLLDEAYVAAKVAIEQLRGGDTLVRSLNFESSEEEYLYEIDRNDTHRMLVTVLLREKMKADSGVETRVGVFMNKADDLRARAEKQAASGDHEAAVHTLEESTKEIVKAIRSAGIYIPG